MMWTSRIPSPDPPLPPRTLDPESLKAKLLRRVSVDPETGCWEWEGAHNDRGYSQISVGNRISKYAHRVSYELHVGPIPDGLQIDHLCRNPGCVNPEHLEPVTSRENTLRGNSACARHARKTHCVHGHPFTEENTYWRPDGKGKYCLVCARLRAGFRCRRCRKRVWDPQNRELLCSSCAELLLDLAADAEGEEER